MIAGLLVIITFFAWGMRSTNARYRRDKRAMISDIEMMRPVWKAEAEARINAMSPQAREVFLKGMLRVCGRILDSDDKR